MVDPVKKTKLVLAGDAQAVGNLLGCRVTVEGQMHFGALKVASYEVLDAGYGTRPHVGILEFGAGALRMQDVNSGALLELSGRKTEGLEQFVGATILVNGVIVGPHLVQVMSYRILLLNEDGKSP